MDNKTQLVLTYAMVVLIWSSTPLVISWSNIGISSWFSVLARMLLGFAFCLLILAVLRQKLPLDLIALKNYLTASVGIWLSMSLIHLSVAYIHSGFIAVVFGFTPLFTGLFSMMVLKNNPFSLAKILGISLAFIGLIFIYQQSLVRGKLVLYGLLLVFVAMISQSLVGVVLKNINAHTSAIQTATGAAGVALVPLFIFWYFFDGTLPSHISDRTLFAIGYLGIFGSVIGFVGYYYIIKHLNINQVGLLPLITPVFALILGYFFNQEVLSINEIIGVSLIIIGLCVYLLSPSKNKPILKY